MFMFLFENVTKPNISLKHEYVISQFYYVDEYLLRTPAYIIQFMSHHKFMKLRSSQTNFKLIICMGSDKLLLLREHTTTHLLTHLY